MEPGWPGCTGELGRRLEIANRLKKPRISQRKAGDAECSVPEWAASHQCCFFFVFFFQTKQQGTAQVLGEQ
jgi:hypothetical protein